MRNLGALLGGYYADTGTGTGLDSCFLLRLGGYGGCEVDDWGQETRGTQCRSQTFLA